MKTLLAILLCLMCMGCAKKTQDTATVVRELAETSYIAGCQWEEVIYNKIFQYSKHNKGILQHGYYFPDVEGALETVGSGVNNLFYMSEGEYIIKRTMEIKGCGNIFDGSGTKFTRLYPTLEWFITVSGDGNTIMNFCFDFTCKKKEDWHERNMIPIANTSNVEFDKILEESEGI